MRVDHRVDHTDLAAAGYFSEWSVPAGGTAQFHLSTVDPATTVSLTRLDRAGGVDPGWPVARSDAALEVQHLRRGASLSLALGEGLLAPEDWALRLEFRLSALSQRRVLLSTADFSLDFDRDGRPCLRADDPPAVSANEPLPVGRWLVLDVHCSTSRCRVSIAESAGGATVARLEGNLAARAPRGMTIGAARAGDTRTLDVAIGRIAIASRGAEVAAFRIPAVGRCTRLAPMSGDGAELRFHNAPTFATRSARWDGTAQDPRRAPDHYDAVRLHDDDLDDAGWPVTHRIAVPEEAESGVYGLTVHAAGRSVTWPFFVTSRRRGADLLFLVPTFTYLAYADERLPEDRFPWQCDDVGHRFARANGLTSLYDVHNDETGVSLASFHRPLATIRDDYLYPLCGAPHLLPVDLHLLRFLAAQGMRVDLITDAELDRDGVACLAGTRGLITGSHPEYWTEGMLDAVEAFQESGGHLAYLGGNGFYWVTAREGHTIEVRRGARGIRTWSSEPGEAHLAMTGEPGGLWRDRGRAEHRLLGVGMAAMGFSKAQPYRRTPQSHAADLAWLFDGVGDAPIGAAGAVLGGAGGYEIDSRSAAWGTPPETILLAIADGFDDGYERDDTSGTAVIRGEMTLTQKPGGGLVFAASSVAWCGALPEPDTMNPVGRITLNLLRRFLSRD
jgi:N,N-dimethylformamidase